MLCYGMQYVCYAMIFLWYVIGNRNKGLNDKICYGMLWNLNKKLAHFEVKWQLAKVYHKSIMWTFIFFKMKSLKKKGYNNVVCYAMVWYDKWDSMRLYAML